MKKSENKDKVIWFIASIAGMLIAIYEWVLAPFKFFVFGLKVVEWQVAGNPIFDSTGYFKTILGIYIIADLLISLIFTTAKIIITRRIIIRENYFASMNIYFEVCYHLLSPLQMLFLIIGSHHSASVFSKFVFKAMSQTISMAIVALYVKELSFVYERAERIFSHLLIAYELFSMLLVFFEYDLGISLFYWMLCWPIFGITVEVALKSIAKSPLKVLRETSLLADESDLKRVARLIAFPVSKIALINDHGLSYLHMLNCKKVNCKCRESIQSINNLITLRQKYARDSFDDEDMSLIRGSINKEDYELIEEGSVEMANLAFEQLVIENYLESSKFSMFTCLLYLSWMIEKKFAPNIVLKLILKMKLNSKGFSRSLIFLFAQKELERVAKWYFDKGPRIVERFKYEYMNRLNEFFASVNAKDVDLAFPFIYKNNLEQMTQLMIKFCIGNIKLVEFVDKSSERETVHLETIKLYDLYQKIIGMYKLIDGKSNEVQIVHIAPYMLYLTECVSLHQTGLKIMKEYRDRTLRKLQKLLQLKETEINDYNLFDKALILLLHSSGAHMGEIHDYYGNTNMLKFYGCNELIGLHMDEFILPGFRTDHKDAVRMMTNSPMSSFYGRQIRSILRVPGTTYFIPSTFVVKLTPLAELGYSYAVAVILDTPNSQYYMNLDKSLRVTGYSINMQYLFNSPERFLTTGEHIKVFSKKLFAAIEDRNPKSKEFDETNKDLKSKVSIDGGIKSSYARLATVNRGNQRTRQIMPSSYDEFGYDSKIKVKTELFFYNKKDKKKLYQPFIVEVDKHEFQYSDCCFYLLKLTKVEEAKDIYKHVLDDSASSSDESPDFDINPRRLPDKKDEQQEDLESLPSLNSERKRHITTRAGKLKVKFLHQGESDTNEIEDKFSDRMFETKQEEHPPAESRIIPQIKNRLADVKSVVLVDLKDDDDDEEEEKQEIVLDNIAKMRKQAISPNFSEPNKRTTNFAKGFMTTHILKLETTDEQGSFGGNYQAEGMKTITRGGSYIKKRFFRFEECLENSPINKNLAGIIALYIIALILVSILFIFMKITLQTKNSQLEIGLTLNNHLGSHFEVYQNFYLHTLNLIALDGGLIKSNRYARFNFSEESKDIPNSTDYFDPEFNLRDIRQWNYGEWAKHVGESADILMSINKDIESMFWGRDSLFENNITLQDYMMNHQFRNIMVSTYNGYLVMTTMIVRLLYNSKDLEFRTDSPNPYLQFMLKNNLNSIPLTFKTYSDFLVDFVITSYSKFVNTLISLLSILAVTVVFITIITLWLIYKIWRVFGDFYELQEHIFQPEIDDRLMTLEKFKNVLQSFKDSRYSLNVLDESQFKTISSSSKVKDRTPSTNKRRQRRTYCFKITFSIVVILMFYIFQVMFSAVLLYIFRLKVNEAIWIIEKQSMASDLVRDQFLIVDSFKQFIVQGYETNVLNLPILEYYTQLYPKMTAKSDTIRELFNVDSSDANYDLAEKLTYLKTTSLCISMEPLWETMDLCELLDNKIPKEGLMSAFFRVNNFLRDLVGKVIDRENFNITKYVEDSELISFEYTLDSIYGPSFQEISNFILDSVKLYTSQGITGTVNNLLFTMITSMIISFWLAFFAFVNLKTQAQKVKFSLQLFGPKALIDNVYIRNKMEELVKYSKGLN